MSLTVGLDFGTHQTKICIENAASPTQKIYEFLEIENQLLFPSVVQINEDDTLSYGIINEKSKELSSNIYSKPLLKEFQKPECVLPPKPKKNVVRGLSLKEQIEYNKKFDDELENWELDCIAIKIDYEYDVQEYFELQNQAQKEYEIELSNWQEKNKPQKQIFRYFKLATFSNQPWDFIIKPEIISVWYITFIFFKIIEKYGNNFYTQLGVPYNVNNKDGDIQKERAFKILIAANNLIDHYQNIDDFLNETYLNLIQVTCLIDVKESDKQKYGINVIPEAFAGLTSVTQQGKISEGMHLLIDIGGGTTDIAFFTITKNKLPNIHRVLSFPKGLNFIFNEFNFRNNIFNTNDTQNKFFKSQNEFSKEITTYHAELDRHNNKIIQEIIDVFTNDKTQHELDLIQLTNAMQDRPILFCGGGSMYKVMRKGNKYFTDIQLINKDVLSITNVKNSNFPDLYYTILATSYGLSIQLENEIELTDINFVFSHLKTNKNELKNINDHEEHGLADA